MNYDLLKGCLCWFWDKDDSKKKIGILVDYYGTNNPYPFYELDGGFFAHCEPAKYKDVLFYNENPMKQVYLTAKEKAENGIIEAVDEYFKNIKDDYKDSLPNFVEGMRENKEHYACAESENVVKAIEKYMEIL